jgi:hypothetical protein
MIHLEATKLPNYIDAKYLVFFYCVVAARHNG